MKNHYTALQGLILFVAMLVISSCLPVSPLNPSNPKCYCLWNFTGQEIVVSTDKDSGSKSISPEMYLILGVDTREVTVTTPHSTRRTYSLPEHVMGGLTLRRGRPCMDIGITDKWKIHELRDKTYNPKTKESTFEIGNSVAEYNR